MNLFRVGDQSSETAIAGATITSSIDLDGTLLVFGQRGLGEGPPTVELTSDAAHVPIGTVKQRRRNELVPFGQTAPTKVRYVDVINDGVVRVRTNTAYVTANFMAKITGDLNAARRGWAIIATNQASARHRVVGGETVDGKHYLFVKLTQE